VRLNRAKLELVSGVQFGDDGVEELQEVFTVYAERGADVTPMSFWDPDHIIPVAQQESRALRALVEGVWRCGSSTAAEGTADAGTATRWCTARSFGCCKSCSINTGSNRRAHARCGERCRACNKKKQGCCDRHSGCPTKQKSGSAAASEPEATSTT
jgi:hypothetical protein